MTGRRLFICYRREDSEDLAALLHTWLAREPHAENVFMDIDDVPYGVDFRETVHSDLTKCDAVIALIGPRWVQLLRERANDPQDFVRVELETADEMGIPIFPVLLKGTRHPKIDELPDEFALKNKLPFLNSMRLRSGRDRAGDYRILRDAVLPAAEPSQSTGGGDKTIVADWEDEAPESQVLSRLRVLHAGASQIDLPFLFESLASDQPAIAEAGLAAVKAIGWTRITGMAERAAPNFSDADAQKILDGIAVVEAANETVRLLDRFASVARAETRVRAFALRDRKQLSLDMLNLNAAFNDHGHSYELTRLLGTGSFTASYEAHHIENRALKCVVRVLRREFARNDAIRLAFSEMNTRSLAYVHPQLAHVRTANKFSDLEIYYCVRDFIEGRVLRDVIGPDHRVSPHDALTTMREILSVISTIHGRGHAHGGLRPSNLYLDPDDRVVVGDCALPPSLSAGVGFRRPQDLRYAAPETFAEDVAPDPTADFYSLGCLGFELVTGHPPFVSDDPFELIQMHRTQPIREIAGAGSTGAPKFVQLLQRFAAKVAKDRPHTSAEAVGLIESCISQLGGSSEALPEPIFRGVVPDDGEDLRTRIGYAKLAKSPNPGELPGIDFELSSESPAQDWPAGEFPGGPSSTDWARPSEAPAATKIAPGAVIRGRFRLDDLLGVGGMGTVYLGTDLVKETAKDKQPQVALKVLNEDFKQHPESFIALQREASRQQKLAHPNIATVYDFDKTEDGMAFLVMEVLEGTPLNNFIRKVVRPKGGLPFKDALPMVQGLGRALVYAHERSIVHSDFKPGNCFITTEGQMKVMDFGLGRAVKSKGTAEGESTLFDPGKLGALTPAYASVEMLEGEEPDTRDDIYALACVTYELLTGRHPFNKLPANSARDNDLMPIPIKGLTRKQWRGLARGLSFAREERSQTIEEFLEEFEGEILPWKNPFVVGPAAIVLLALAGLFPTLNYLEEQDIKKRIELIESADRTQLLSLLDAISEETDSELTRNRLLYTVSTVLPEAFGDSMERLLLLPLEPGSLARASSDAADARKLVERLEQFQLLSDTRVLFTWRAWLEFREAEIKLASIMGSRPELDRADARTVSQLTEQLMRIDPIRADLTMRPFAPALLSQIDDAYESENFTLRDELIAVAKTLPIIFHCVRASNGIVGCTVRDAGDGPELQ